MPYIVATTRRWRYRSTDGPIEAEKTSRRAVATLEEARTLAADAVCLSERHGQYTQGEAYARARTLPESGGTVTLPDGTVIEVSQASWFGLTRGLSIGAITLPTRAEDGDSDAQRRILAAFNARESGQGKEATR